MIAYIHIFKFLPRSFANRIRCSSNIAIDDHFPSKTFSFKHHLIMTGEAWPASRAILAWYLYILRTSTIARNRHLNIVLQAELFLRTGTYDRPKNTVPVPVQDTVIRLDPPSPEKTPSPGDRRLSTYSLLLIRQTIWATLHCRGTLG